MSDQPLTRLLMQVAHGRAACYHHPHRILCVSWLSRLPLSFGYKKITDLFYVERAQHGIEALAKTCIICHISLFFHFWASAPVHSRIGKVQLLEDSLYKVR